CTRYPPRSPLFPYTTLFRSNFQSNLYFLIPVSLLRWKVEVFVECKDRIGLNEFVATLLSVSKRRLEIATTSREIPDNECCTIIRSEEHTSELQSRENLVCRL